VARLLHLSDLHVTTPGTMASGVLDTCALLRDAVDLLLDRRAAIGPLDAVLVTGDISDDGTAASYAEARLMLDRLGLPLLVVPGNHDRRDALRTAFSDLVGMPTIGPIDWVRDIGATRIIGLDTLVEGQGGGRLEESSLMHLSEALHTWTERSVVVALHHPPLRTGILFMDAIGLDDMSALGGILQRFDRRLLVVAGHVHGVYHGRIGGHPVVTAPAICSAFTLDRRHDAPVGFVSGPRGCAILDSADDGVWTMVPLQPSNGFHAF